MFEISSLYIYHKKIETCPLFKKKYVCACVNIVHTVYIRITYLFNGIHNYCCGNSLMLGKRIIMMLVCFYISKPFEVDILYSVYY